MNYPLRPNTTVTVLQRSNTERIKDYTRGATFPAEVSAVPADIRTELGELVCSSIHLFKTHIDICRAPAGALQISRR